MSFLEICLASVLIGTTGTLLIAIIIGVSVRRYRRELIEAGGAQTTLGSIGCVYLESKAQVLVSFSIAIPLGLVLGGSQGLLLLYLGLSAFPIITSVLVIVCLFLLAWLFLVVGDVKARLVKGRVLRRYWSHRNEEILRLELVILSEGDETKRRALEMIAERGCRASLVAREIIAGKA
ncbi:MAG: hypothetical protein RTU09_07185 [Candidatus Thorarchaeota archaeon]